MKFKNYRFTNKKRRGLSSIVGALLFVVLMVATFSVLSVALTTQTDIASTSRDVAARDLARQQEDFTMASQTNALPPPELTVNVDNDAKIPLEIFSLVISDQQAEPGFISTTTVYDIPADASFIMPGEEENILLTTVPPITLPLPLATENEIIYTFKTVSSLGNFAFDTIFCTEFGCTDPVTPPGDGSLRHSLFMDGPTGINTKTSTLVMFVFNTSDETVTDVQPFFGFDVPGPLDCTDMWIELIVAPLPNAGVDEDITNCVIVPDTPAAPVILGPHETMLFKWDFTVEGDVGTVYRFCNYAIGNSPGPIDSQPQTCDEIEVIDPNDCGLVDCGGGDGDEDILDERFITRPELFLTIPSPFGAPGSCIACPDRALWGANVVNPTDTTMFIHKITITAFPPAANKNFLVIASHPTNQVHCNPQDISPGNGTIPGTQITEAGFWTCPGQNTIMWRNYANPITLPPQSTFPFLVQLESDRPISAVAESVLVDSTVYTTSGAFGKGNYQSTAYPLSMYANVFATTDWLDGVNRDNIISDYSGICSGDVQRFSVVFTDFDTDPLTFIEAGSKLVVNVPRAFKEVIVIDAETSNPGILIDPGIEPTVVIHPDETTQIIATVPDRIGDVLGIEYVVLTFEGLAPTVDTNKLMVMYTLANGLGEPNSSVGPLTEIVLQVIPDPC